MRFFLDDFKAESEPEQQAGKLGSDEVSPRSELEKKDEDPQKPRRPKTPSNPKMTKKGVESFSFINKINNPPLIKSSWYRITRHGSVTRESWLL